MKKQEIIKIVESIKPLPFFTEAEKKVFQLALDLVKAQIEES